MDSSTLINYGLTIVIPPNNNNKRKLNNPPTLPSSCVTNSDSCCSSPPLEIKNYNRTIDNSPSDLNPAYSDEIMSSDFIKHHHYEKITNFILLKQLKQTLNKLNYANAPFGTYTTSINGFNPRELQLGILVSSIQKHYINCRGCLFELLSFQMLDNFHVNYDCNDSRKKKPQPSTIAKTIRFFIKEQIIIKYLHFTSSPEVIYYSLQMINLWDKETILDNNYKHVSCLAYLLTCNYIHYSVTALNATYQFDLQKRKEITIELSKIPEIKPAINSNFILTSDNLAELKTLRNSSTNAPLTLLYSNRVPPDLCNMLHKFVYCLIKNDLQAIGWCLSILNEYNKRYTITNKPIIMNAILKKVKTIWISKEYSRFHRFPTNHKTSKTEDQLHNCLSTQFEASSIDLNFRMYINEWTTRTHYETAHPILKTRSVHTICVWWGSPIVKEAIRRIACHLNNSKEPAIPTNNNPDETYTDFKFEELPIEFEHCSLPVEVIDKNESDEYSDLPALIWKLIYEINLHNNYSNTPIVKSYQRDILEWHSLYREECIRKNGKRRETVQAQGKKLKIIDHQELQKQCLIQAILQTCRIKFIFSSPWVESDYLSASQKIRLELKNRESKDFINYELLQYTKECSVENLRINNLKFQKSNPEGNETCFICSIPEDKAWGVVRKIMLSHFPHRKEPQIYKPACYNCHSVNIALFILSPTLLTCSVCYNQILNNNNKSHTVQVWSDNEEKNNLTELDEDLDIKQVMEAINNCYYDDPSTWNDGDSIDLTKELDDFDNNMYILPTENNDIMLIDDSNEKKYLPDDWDLNYTNNNDFMIHNNPQYEFEIEENWEEQQRKRIKVLGGVEMS